MSQHAIDTNHIMSLGVPFSLQRTRGLALDLNCQLSSLFCEKLNFFIVKNIYMALKAEADTCVPVMVNFYNTLKKQMISEQV